MNKIESQPEEFALGKNNMYIDDRVKITILKRPSWIKWSIMETSMKYCNWAHHSDPAQLILLRRQRQVVSGHSQSLQLTGLDESLPLICQQQSSLNYKRRLYTAHMKGAPWGPSLGDNEGCDTGPYRTPTTLGHTTKTGSHSSST